MEKVFNRRLFFFLLIFFQQTVFAQQHKIDSLLDFLNQTLEDTTKIRTLNRLETQYSNEGDYDKAIATADSAKKFGERYLTISHSDKERKIVMLEMGKAYCNVGVIFSNRENFPVSLENYFAGLDLFEAIEKENPNDKNAKNGIAAAYNSIGNVYTNLYENDKALDYYFKALKFSQETNDKAGLAKCMNNIGVVYNNMHKYPEAKEQFLNSLNVKLELLEKEKANGNATAIRSDEKGVTFAYNNIGNVYMREGEAALDAKRWDSVSNKFTLALQYYSQALKIRQEIKDDKGIAISIGDIGDVYAREGDSASFRGNKNLAFGFSKKALDYHLRAFTIAKNKGFRDVERDNSESIADEYEGIHQPDSALKYYRHFIALRDTLLSQENTRKSVETEMNFQFDKKSAIEKVEQAKKDAIAESDKRRENTVLMFVVGGLLLVIVFSGFLFNRFRVTQSQKTIIEQQKTVVEEKQKEILDSIRYAKRIQQSLLPPEKYIDRTLERLRKTKNDS